MKDKFILDACCGGKMMWNNKNQPNTIYIDIREEEIGFIKSKTTFKVKPDFIMDFRKLKFQDKRFKLIVWDPPHMKFLGDTSIFKKQFGVLNAETWPYDLKQGFKELWRCLDDYGVLIFKFNDHDIPFKQVLNLFPVKYLFGQIAKNTPRSTTKWFTFMKIPK